MADPEIQSSRHDAELAASEARYRALIEATAQFVWRRLVGGNSSRPENVDWWVSLTGQTAAEAGEGGLGWLAALHPDDREKARLAWSTAFSTRTLLNVEYRVRTKDGEYRHFIVRGVPVESDNTPGATEWIGSFTDVTNERVSRMRVEHLQRITSALMPLRTMSEIGQSVVQTLSDVLYTQVAWLGRISEDGEYLETLGSLGVRDDIIQKYRRYRVSDTLPVCDALRAGEPQWWPDTAVMARLYPQHGTMIRDVDRRAAAIVPLMISEGASARRVGALSLGFSQQRTFDADTKSFIMTVAQQCAQALERARLSEAAETARLEAERRQREAENANEAKATFLATMSHELRTPLNAIQGHVQLLEMGLHGPLSERQLQTLARVQNAQRRLMGVINDVLNFAKLEAGRVDFDIVPTAIGDVVRDIVPLIEPQLAAKGLRLVLDLSDDDNRLRVLADRDKLGQVLLNLLSNAIKFTPPLRRDGQPGMITVAIAAATEANTALITLRDTGIGIPAEKHEAIFDPFVQVRAGYAHTTEGTGLGLAISRDLVRRMGGDIAIHSVTGEGATFTVSLRRAILA